MLQDDVNHYRTYLAFTHTTPKREQKFISNERSVLIAEICVSHPYFVVIRNKQCQQVDATSVHT